MSNVLIGGWVGCVAILRGWLAEMAKVGFEGLASSKGFLAALPSADVNGNKWGKGLLCAKRKQSKLYPTGQQ